VVPLRDVLRSGAADGTFVIGDAEREATLIGAMAWETSARLRECRSKREREELRASLLAFVRRALHPADD
jgi:hypothetical protein